MAGAAIGGTLATIVDGQSGPVFWMGLGVGGVAGSVCLPRAFRRREPRSEALAARAGPSDLGRVRQASFRNTRAFDSPVAATYDP